MIRPIFLIWIFIYSNPIFSQVSEKQLEKHVYFLANDSLEGRLTGSKGEEIAYTYINNRFKEISIGSYPGNNSYKNTFSFRSGKEYGESNRLLFNGKSLSIDEDYYPLVYSGNEAINSHLTYLNFGFKEDYKKKYKKKCVGNAVMIESSIPGDIDPHSEKMENASLRNRLELAVEHGASAVIVINSYPEEMDTRKDFEKNIFPMEIPVVFVKDHIIKEIKKKKPIPIDLATDLIQIYGEGNNIIGYLDGPSDEMVVIGAHYDHLGWGIAGSRYMENPPMIHNGADDNASGVALMIEIARSLSQNKSLNYDYCFVGFSGEELGLYGSKSLFDKEFFNPENINYMLNMDMVGRLNYNEKELAVNGVGTSSAWLEALERVNDGGVLSLKTKESGQGPSDHAPFYFNNIPVLHFFTGSHEDYHHPNDDAERVNYKGMVEIGQMIIDLILDLDKKESLDFIKTKDESQGDTPRFTVTLGVMPDYMFEGKGMRIDGVTEGKVANEAGILKGDIVLKIGDINVVDLMTYMEGLSKFKKGDQTTVIIDRDGEQKEYLITFK